MTRDTDITDLPDTMSDDGLQEEDSVLRVEFLSMPKWQRPSPLIALASFFLLVVGQGIALTSTVDAMTLIICRHQLPEKSINNSLDGHFDPRCRQSDITAAVALFASYQGAIAGIVGTIVSPKLCALSDRVGRRPLLIYLGLATVIADAIMLLCAKYPNELDYKWMYVSGLVAGVSGLTLGSSLYGSYIADCVKTMVRPKYISWMEAAVFSGIAVGPSVGSLILQRTNSLTLILAITVVFDVTYTATIYLFVPESRTMKARRKSITSYVSSSQERLEYTLMQQWLDAINVFKPLRQLAFKHLEHKRDRINARLLVLIIATSAAAGVGLGRLLLLYPELMFEWTSVETGYLISMIGALKSGSLGLLFPVAYRLLEYVFAVRNHQLDHIDTTLLRIGLLGSFIGYAGVSMANTGFLFAAGIAWVDVLSGITSPTIKNVIIKYANKDDIGEVFGAIGMIIQIESIFCPFIFLMVFNRTIDYRPNAVFEIVAFICAIMVVMCLFLAPAREPRTDIEAAEGVDNGDEEVDPLDSSEHDPLVGSSTTSYSATAK